MGIRVGVSGRARMWRWRWRWERRGGAWGREVVCVGEDVEVGGGLLGKVVRAWRLSLSHIFEVSRNWKYSQSGMDIF